VRSRRGHRQQQAAQCLAAVLPAGPRRDALRRRLTLECRRYGDRLLPLGFVTNMADWLRCADAVVTKAGPGTIAETLCCGTPLLLTSCLSGQEKGNAEFVVSAGAGRPGRGCPAHRRRGGSRARPLRAGG
jgi:hypothetical protein